MPCSGSAPADPSVRGGVASRSVMRWNLSALARSAMRAWAKVALGWLGCRVSRARLIVSAQGRWVGKASGCVPRKSASAR